MAQGDDRELTQTHRLPGPGDPADPSAPDARVWGEFRLIGELGRGAFGHVYHAWDPTLARDIALKVVRLPDPSRAAAALHEGRMLARVRHRNVVTVHGAQRIGDEVGVWMELVRGRHLSAIVREHGPMGAEEAALIGISVCQALAAVHAAGLLHRDIKANNVMRESGGRIVLMDVGAGRESSVTTAGDLTGTPLYMAPEVLDGRPASPRSDIYSVGVLLYHVVTGDYPVAGRSVLDLSLAHRRGQRRLLSDRRPDLPDGFVRVVEHALAPAPADRPPSAGAMLRDLSSALPASAALDRQTPGAPPGEWVPHADPSSVSAPPSSSAGVAPHPSVARVLAGLVVGVATLGLLGFLTTTAFNLSLERDAAFSDDRLPGDWFVFGASSLFGPALLVALVFLAGRLAVTVGRLILRLAPPLQAGVHATRSGLTRLAARAGANDVVAASQWLLVGQVVALPLIWLRFIGLIEAVTVPGEVSATRLTLLTDDSIEPFLYRGALTLLLLGMALGWYAVLSRPGAGASVHRTTVIAGAAVMVLALLMLVVPYRLLYHNEAPQVELDDARCYEVGAREPQVLLYCPDLPPPRVKLADRTQTRPTGIRENIFTEAAPAP